MEPTARIASKRPGRSRRIPGSRSRRPRGAEAADHQAPVPVLQGPPRQPPEGDDPLGASGRDRGRGADRCRPPARPRCPGPRRRAPGGAASTVPGTSRVNAMAPREARARIGSPGRPAPPPALSPARSVRTPMPFELTLRSATPLTPLPTLEEVLPEFLRQIGYLPEGPDGRSGDGPVKETIAYRLVRECLLKDPEQAVVPGGARRGARGREGVGLPAPQQAEVPRSPRGGRWRSPTGRAARGTGCGTGTSPGRGTSPRRTPRTPSSGTGRPSITCRR